MELIQAAVLVTVGFALGWNPGGPAGAGVLVGAAIGAMVLGTVAFGGIGLFLAGTLKPLVNLAVVNGLFVVLLLLGGMLIPLAKLPGWLADIARVLRPRPWPMRCMPPSGAAHRCPPGTGSCSSSGPWPLRWWPGSPSAGSEPGHGAVAAGDGTIGGRARRGSTRRTT